MGCAASGPAQVLDASPLPSEEKLPQPSIVLSSPRDLPTNTGQTLPISADAEMGVQRIMLEVARTPQEQTMGLMYRTSLAPNRGMLFIFEPPQAVSFWMKNTKIYLDMVFLRDGQVKAIAENVPPCTTSDCPTYGSGVPIDQVIEIPGGRAAQLGLKVGDQVRVEFHK